MIWWGRGGWQPYLSLRGGSVEYARNGWAQQLIANAEKTHVPLEQLQFTQGLEYLSKDFFALLMFFHLQFYFIFNGVICGASKKSKFPGMKIITQGYDYPIPSFKKGFGLLPGRWYIPFIRTFLGHGIWLKEPMQVRGITKDQVQQNILYAMIYLFNEMMIEMGTLFNTDGEARVFHIDSRGSVGRTGWAMNCTLDLIIFSKRERFSWTASSSSGRLLINMYLLSPNPEHDT